MFGRHLVLRGVVSYTEGDELRRALDALPDAEREELLRDRAMHREAAVLLHEWAHTLGAFHERDADTLMSPRYGHAESAFSEAEAHAGASEAARAACTAADRGPPWPYEPAYVLGVLAGSDGRWAEARDHLRRALEREERDPAVWSRLGAAYERLGATDDLEKLGAPHRARFGKPLRPSR